MRYAIFSDLHDSLRGWELLLSHAQRNQANALIYLGDVGQNPQLFRTLQDHAIPCLFGNWEVSGYGRLPPDLADAVAQWPATCTLDAAAGDAAGADAGGDEQGAACCAHATPAMPAHIRTTQDAARHMQQGHSWASLFPRLHNDESARWEALAALETASIPLAFHGHTHVQMLWAYGPVTGRPAAGGRESTRRWRSQSAPQVYPLAAATTRYLIGVGSAGQPDDGPQPRYVIYDTTAQTVELCAIPTRL